MAEVKVTTYKPNGHTKFSTFNATMEVLLPRPKADQVLCDIDLRSNGKYDAVLVSKKDGNMFHLVAERRLGSIFFFGQFRRSRLFVNNPPVVTIDGEVIRGEDFVVLKADDAGDSRSKAIRTLGGEECLQTCYPPIREEAVPKREPLLNRNEDSVVDQYCIDKVVDVHRIGAEEAAGAASQLRERVSASAADPSYVNSLLANACGDLKVLRRLVNHCKQK